MPNGRSSRSVSGVVEATKTCERCGRLVDPGTVHRPVGEGCVVATPEQLERSTAMDQAVRRSMS